MVVALVPVRREHRPVHLRVSRVPPGAMSMRISGTAAVIRFLVSCHPSVSAADRPGSWCRYTFYYYFCRSDMSGFMQVCRLPPWYCIVALLRCTVMRLALTTCVRLQTAFYFGYMSVVCYAFLLMLGTVGFRASLTFVRSSSAWPLY